MLTKNGVLANTIVNIVLQDLHGRKGVGNELDDIDAYVYKDMCETLNAKVEQILDGEARDS